MSKHKPTVVRGIPWSLHIFASDDGGEILDVVGKQVVGILPEDVAPGEWEWWKQLHAFIVQRVNAHDDLVVALERLGSMEAMARSGTIDKHRDAELLARIEYATAALGKVKEKP